ncbi:hypothetical protein [uncultured Thiodictyon sp.]|uniref:hypothetical protein n=1 Tax=uncultured Thiodictyon sp. TaxID=1846217 RepID=UPI0025EA8B0F|nr:hypothetical protein [uncultured Thiodictyon sp.]
MAKTHIAQIIFDTSDNLHGVWVSSCVCEEMTWQPQYGLFCDANDNPMSTLALHEEGGGLGQCWYEDHWGPAIQDSSVVGGWRRGSEEEVSLEEFKISLTKSVIDAWQGRYVLAGMLPVTEGPLASFPAPNVLAQMDLFVAANLTVQEQVRYHGAKTWRPTDPMVATLGALLGLNDAAIYAWFESARAVP